jgi:DNA repair exonuclease SbcCD ATPase subunit
LTALTDADGAAQARPRLNLPRLVSARLDQLSLYSLAPHINVDFGSGVYCLAGANGLGKSTFVAAINYAITGLVPEPGRKFESVEEYYRHTFEFSRRFFTGRIREAERDQAAVSVVMDVGWDRYELTRNLFEPQELVRLSIGESDSSDMTGRARQDLYASSLAKAVGLASFQQFAFLQLHLLTFDERRHLLFWDQRALEQALFLAFGMDPAEATRADDLRRSIDRLDSNVRNAKYRATEAANKLRDIEAFSKDAALPDEDLLHTWEEIRDRAADAERAVGEAGRDLGDASLQAATVSSVVAAAETDYASLFQANPSPALAFHPLVRRSMLGRCELCHAEGSQIAQGVESRTRTDTCPLCGTLLSSRPKRSEVDLPVMQAASERVDLARAEQRENGARILRLQEEYELARTRLIQSSTELNEFERQHGELQLISGAATPDAYSNALRTQVSDALRQRDDALERRETAKKNLNLLQRELTRTYRTAELEFVPLFQDLAFAFLGIDLSVALESRSNQLGLTLTVASDARREPYELSESQRFFVDIALRMALAAFVARDSATLLIDTPEGSLDIAYESRAGEMFARFVRDGNHLVMTANINASSLLRRLAEKCGPQLMTVERMTSWAELSDVQIAEEAGFVEAMALIEGALLSSDLG